MTAPILQVKELSLFRGTTRVLQDVSFEVGPGLCVGLLAAGGAGKTTLASALVGALGQDVRSTGDIRINDSLLDASSWNSVRGRVVAAVPQDALAAFDTTLPLGPQLANILALHEKLPRRKLRDRVDEISHQLGVLAPHLLSSATQLWTSSPSQLPLGAVQLATLAAALLCNPRLLILDGFGVHLDALSVERALSFLRRHCQTRGVSALLLSADPSLVGNYAEHTLVLHQGKIVERGSTEAVLSRGEHPHTRSLVSAFSSPREVPQELRPAGQPRSSDVSEVPYVRAVRLSRAWEKKPLFRRRQVQWTVQDVSLQLRRRETLGLIGHVGAGKSSLARLLLRLEHATTGRIAVANREITHQGERDLRRLRKEMQLVLRTTTQALNPLLTLRDSLGEPLLIHQPGLLPQAQEELLRAALGRVALPAAVLDKRPQDLSYTEGKLVNLARALVLPPTFLILDETVDGLDPLERERTLQLLAELRRENRCLLLISHDLAAVRHVATGTAVMLHGRIIEIGPTELVFTRRAHPYTRELLRAERVLPPPRQRLQILQDASTDPTERALPTGGCSYVQICPRADGRCQVETPELQQLEAGHQVACFYPITPSHNVA